MRHGRLIALVVFLVALAVALAAVRLGHGGGAHAPFFGFSSGA